MKTWYLAIKVLISLCTLLLLFYFSVIGLAQADCGEIIIPAGFVFADDPEERSPIDDCLNPFGETAHVDSEITPTLDGQEILEGAEIVVDELPVTYAYSELWSGIPDGIQVGDFALYHQVGADYYLVPTTPTDVVLSATGTYFLVSHAYELIFVENTAWWHYLTDLLIPKTVYAQVPTFDEVYVTSFTLSLPDPAPTGASSVLFLPGIQASRLYTNGSFGTENRLWEPNIDADVEKLAMTEAGESINAIYTRDVLDEVYGTLNIYKGLLDMLDDYQEDGVIQSYEAFAYDWRYDVFSVATEAVLYPEGETKQLVDIVKRLAADSYTGKVTIIGHSNGGLVAKALLATYGDTELSGLVDKLVMVGTPQLGTPKAIGSLLHGIEQGSPFGFVISTPTAREVTRNMPGAYALLPSDGYFAAATEPVVTTDGKPTTQAVATYGDINQTAALTSFLLDSNDQWPEDVSIHEPLTLNASLLADTELIQQSLNSFVAPEAVAVYEVVGTGLPTIKGFEYREFSCAGSVTCIIPPFAKPIPLFSTAGDQTVMTISASGYQGDKTVVYVDLKLEGEQFLEKDTEHKNMVESPTIQELLTEIIEYTYLSDTLALPEEYTSVETHYTIIGAHSPVNLLFEDGSGKRVGRVDGQTKQEIIGSHYFELGSSKYVVVPSSDDYTVYMEGEEVGAYSLTIDELAADGTQENIKTIVGLPVTPSMRAQFTKQSGVFGPIVTDTDGNSISDTEYNWDGSVVKLANELPATERNKNGSRGKQISEEVLQLAPVGSIVSTSIDQPRVLNEYEKKLYVLLVQLQDLLTRMYVSN